MIHSWRTRGVSNQAFGMPGGALRSALCRTAQRTTFIAQRRALSSTFGARDGAAIENKSTILAEVDVALNQKRPPDLELLLTDHLTCIDSDLTIAMHTAILRYGHVAVRYRTSDGVQRVMNILGSLDAEGSQMVNFVPPEEYLYGTAVRDRGFGIVSSARSSANVPFSIACAWAGLAHVLSAGWRVQPRHRRRARRALHARSYRRDAFLL